MSRVVIIGGNDRGRGDRDNRDSGLGRDFRQHDDRRGGGGGGGGGRSFGHDNRARSRSRGAGHRDTRVSKKKVGEKEDLDSALERYMGGGEEGGSGGALDRELDNYWGAKGDGDKEGSKEGGKEKKGLKGKKEPKAAPLSKEDLDAQLASFMSGEKEGEAAESTE